MRTSSKSKDPEIAVLQTQMDIIETKVDDLNTKLDKVLETKVDKEEFNDLKKIVWFVISTVGIAVIGAILKLILIN